MYRSLLQRNSKVCPYHAEICNSKKSRPSFRPNAAACGISRVVNGRVSFMVWEYVSELPIRPLVDGLPFRKDALSGVLTGPFRLAMPRIRNHSLASIYLE
ncbi:hypothetical protein CDAR_421571 [Caerostris darwini]|uniref:Uncharacterized protein n=1 Tax=Caerostris darwini TaxID=1538125 RepID=A0AAV4SUG5_9ARAC|nr:hypothetical protein CDAR_421571 [Caerostris darwini]